MIQKTIYLRDGDEEGWNELENKAEFIHNALNPGRFIKVPKMTAEALAYAKRGDEAAAGVVGINFEKDTIKPCTHGYPPKTCKHAKPGKPCRK